MYVFIFFSLYILSYSPSFPLKPFIFPLNFPSHFFSRLHFFLFPFFPSSFPCHLHLFLLFLLFLLHMASASLLFLLSFLLPSFTYSFSYYFSYSYMCCFSFLLPSFSIVIYVALPSSSYFFFLLYHLSSSPLSIFYLPPIFILSSFLLTLPSIFLLCLFLPTTNFSFTYLSIPSFSPFLPPSFQLSSMSPHYASPPSSFLLLPPPFSFSLLHSLLLPPSLT